MAITTIVTSTTMTPTNMLGHATVINPNTTGITANQTVHDVGYVFDRQATRINGTANANINNQGTVVSHESAPSLVLAGSGIAISSGERR
jgi:hypothetical protein